MAAFAPTADIACAGFMSTRPNKTNGAWSAFRLGLNCCYRISLIFLLALAAFTADEEMNHRERRNERDLDMRRRWP
jgi:hypothetical protein